MNETPNHLAPDRLEAFVEGTVDEAERAVVESHLASCARCELEVADLRNLFEALAGLPELAPSAGFVDRVMVGVRVRRPVLVRVNEWIDQLTPATNRGWALATAAVAMPALAITAAVAWILASPVVSAEALWIAASGQVAVAASAAWQWALATFASSALAARLTGLLELAMSLGRGGLGLAAASFATMTVVSIYVLYDNLFRPNARRPEHATYSF